MLDLGEVHSIRRAKGMVSRINSVVSKYSSSSLRSATLQQMTDDLTNAEKSTTIAAIQNATPEEILAGASRLASLTRTR